MEQVRAYAPAAFRTQKRAVTEADYAAVAGRHPGVQRAIATFRWTGSWHTVFITVDRQAAQPVDAAFEASVRRFVEPFRMAGHDIEVEGPLLVSLEIDMHVCADPAYFRADVKRELLELFSNQRVRRRPAWFVPSGNFTFGQTVYLEPIDRRGAGGAGRDLGSGRKISTPRPAGQQAARRGQAGAGPSGNRPLRQRS